MKGPAARKRFRQRNMDKREIEELREKVGCSALLAQDGWKIDRKESTRRSVKFRRDARIVIVIHGDRGWFDPLSDAKGDVFNLAEHLGARDFVEAAARVASLSGYVSPPATWRRETRPAPLRSVGERWSSRSALAPGSATWCYLTEGRGIPEAVVAAAADQNLLREGPHGSMWAAHRNADGELLGWEERGPEWRGFASGGSKDLFRFGSSDAPRITIVEAAIDGMSLAAIEVQRPDTLYVSTGGGWSPATDRAIRELAARPDVRLVAATDNNRQGDVYADRIREIALATCASFARSRPRADDWNEDLKILRARFVDEPLAAVG